MNSRFLFASPWVEMVLLRYIPPAPIVSAHVLSAPPLLEFTSWARTRAYDVEPRPACSSSLPPELPSWLSLSCFVFARLPSKMHLPYSRNVCVAMSFGLALHHMTQFASFRSSVRHSCWSSRLRLSHRITFCPCRGPQ
jgi:hypothetical protein